MKRLLTNYGWLKGALVLQSISLLTMSCMAVANEEKVLNSDPIHIDGYLKDAQVTDRELEQINGELQKQQTEIKLNKEKTKGYQKLSATTEKLADETETYLAERDESQKVIDEYNKKIDCMMNKRNTPECSKYVKQKRVEDSVNSQASAVAKSETQTQTNNNEDPFVAEGKLKIIPYGGLTSYQSQVGNLESGVQAGIKTEMNVGSRLAIGVGFLYTTLENADYTLNGFGGWSAYGFQRDMEYTRYGVDAYAKFYLLRTERVRPYLSAGVAYGRTNMKYVQNNNTAVFNGQTFAGEEITANVASGAASLGAEMFFTKNIGVNLEFQYSKAFSVSNNTRPFQNYQSFEDPLLRVSNGLNDSDAMSIFGGLVVSF
jgi:opacity protein-like surface antigen